MSATAAIHALPAAEARLIAQANAVADLFAQTATGSLSAVLERAQAEAQAAAARLQSAALFLGDLASGLLQEVEALTAGLAQALAPPALPLPAPEPEPARPREASPTAAEEAASLTPVTLRQAIGPCPPAGDPDAWEKTIQEAEEEAAAGARTAETERYVELAHKATAGAASPAEEAEARAIEDRWDAEARAAEQGPPLDELPPVREAEPVATPRGRRRRKK